MKKMDAMYVCTTPFQIMSAISLAVNRKELADLYIDPQFEGAEELAEKIRKREIFDTVRVLNNLKSVRMVREVTNKVARYRNILYLYRHIEDAAAEILMPDRLYRTLYATHNVFIANLLRFYYSKKEIRTRVDFFDDGEGSYDDKSLYESSIPDRMSRRLMLGSRKQRSPRRIYMYAPDMFMKMHPENEIPVYHLPKFRDNEKVREHLREIFEISEEKGIREPVVILDGMKEGVSQKDCDAMVRLFNEIKEEFGSDRVMIKRHPRDKSENKTGIREYPFSTMPFEIISLASEPDRMTLITLNSTATFMPKLLMDQEPRIVLLHHLFRREGRDDAASDRFFTLIREEYRDPDRVCIPENEEELKELIRTIRTELESGKEEEM